MRGVAPALVDSQLVLSEGPFLHRLHFGFVHELGSFLELDHVLLLEVLDPVSKAVTSGQAKLARATRSAQATQSSGLGRSQCSLNRSRAKPFMDFRKTSL